MAITPFQANELVTRNNVNSRLTEVDNKFTSIENNFPVSVANGGTGGTSISGAVSNLKLTDTTEQDFSANGESAYLQAVQNYFDGHNELYVPRVFNAGWAGIGYGAAFGVQTNNAGENTTLFLFNQKTGFRLYHKDEGSSGWHDYSPNGQVLYDNSSGSGNTIELAQSCANFRELLILYINNNDYHESKTLIDANGKTVVLSTSWIRKSNSTFYQKAVQVRLDGKYIYYDANNKGQFRATATQNYIDDLGSDGVIKICKVIGYNRHV